VSGPKLSDGVLRSELCTELLDACIQHVIYTSPCFDDPEYNSPSNTAVEYRMSRPMVAQLILAKMRTGNFAERILCLNIWSTTDFVSRQVGLVFDCTGGLAIAAAHKLCLSMVVANTTRRIDAKLKPPHDDQLLLNALIAATYAKHIGAVESLLSKGANPNIETLFFGDALSAAAALGNVEILQLFLAQGVSEIQTPSEYTARRRAVDKAALSGNRSIMQLLLSHKHKILRQPSHYNRPIEMAIRSGDKSIVEFLLKDRLLDAQSPNLPIVVDNVVLRPESRTGEQCEAKFWLGAFRIAAEVGNEDIMRLLLESGPTPRGNDLELVIEDACRNDSIAVARLLLSTNPTKISLSGARFWAARGGDQQLIDLTLSKDTSPDVCAYADALAGAFSIGNESTISYIFDMATNRATERPNTHERALPKFFNDVIHLLLFTIPAPEMTRMNSKHNHTSHLKDFTESISHLLLEATREGNLREVAYLATHFIAPHHDDTLNYYFSDSFWEAGKNNQPGIFLFLRKHVSLIQPVDLAIESQRTPILQQMLDCGWNINEPLNRIRPALLGSVSSRVYQEMQLTIATGMLSLTNS
jgi:ankyrin repeat protein